MNDFVKNEEWEFADQLRQLGLGLGVHGAALGFTPEEITAAQDEASGLTMADPPVFSFQNSLYLCALK